MPGPIRFNSADLAALPDPPDGTRYELIDGELLVSRPLHWAHQYTGASIGAALHRWNCHSRAGVANIAPGLIVDDENQVAPDVVWISHARLAQGLEPDGKLHAAPELAIEILSPGSANERRDRELKLKLYSRIGVAEYWIADWCTRTVQVYRRRADGDLQLAATLAEDDALASPLLPGFTLPIGDLWEPFGTVE